MTPKRCKNERSCCNHTVQHCNFINVNARAKNRQPPFVIINNSNVHVFLGNLSLNNCVMKYNKLTGVLNSYMCINKIDIL